MKQTILSFLLMLLPVVAFAQDAVVIDGIYYNLNAETKTAEVTYGKWSPFDRPRDGDGRYSGVIVIPESVDYENDSYSVTSIGYEAFENCRDLTSVTIGNSVTSIIYSAFYGCSGLTSIIVEEGNTVYDSRDNCNAIIKTADNEIVLGFNSSVIPNSVTSIGKRAFSDCYFTSLITSDSEIPTGAYDLPLIIPYSVNNIGEGAFYGCILNSVILPYGVTAIGNSAFENCRRLASIDIPNSVTSIGKDAFKSTAWLSNQPDGLIYAGKIAYYYKGTMPENTSIEFDDGTLAIADDLFLGCNNLISVSIPNSVILIGNNAFNNCKNLTSAIIGNSVTSIGEFAFSYCINLTSVTIGNSVRFIERFAFDGCEKLTSITFPSCLLKIGEASFQNCKNISSVEIPEGVYLIGTFAFNICSSITDLTLPNSLTYLGTHAFYGCTELKNITSKIRRPFTIGHEVFMESTYSNAELKVPYGRRNAYQTIDGWNQFNNIEECDDDGQTDNDVRTIHVSEAGTLSQYIPDSEKYNIYDLTLTGEINGTDLRLLRDMAGHNYKGFFTGGKLRILDLSKVRIICGSERYLDTDTLHTSPYSFYDMIWSTNNTFRLSVEDNDIVPKYVFYICMLNELSLPESAKSIGDNAFASCNYLKHIIIPDNYTSIGRSAFSGCSSLDEISLPNSLEEIGDEAFNYCGINSILIPKGLKSIGENVFTYCKNLASVVSLIQEPFTIGSNVFPSSVLDNATLTVPAGTKEDYLKTEGWNLFKNIVEIERGDGDANGDGIVNVADIMEVVNFIIDNPSNGFNDKAADVNGDGVVDAMDMVQLVNIIIGK